MAKTPARVPYDAELDAAIKSMPPFPVLGAETLEWFRGLNEYGADSVTDKLQELRVRHEERTVDGPRGEIILSIFSPSTPPSNRPAMYWIHGGGMVMGDRFNGLVELDLIDWVAKYNIVLISPEYRLAPEFPAPAGVEDCYAGLLWAAEHADELGVDDKRIVLAGGSGGGGLAAGVGLLVRDKGGPDLLGQILFCAQLDDRNTTISSQQYSAADGVISAWPRETNQYAWNAILGEGHNDRDISIYSAPSRATDLSGLPTTFLDVGSAEVFRDEVVAYASLLWASGVQAELHVWPGGYHAFDFFAPDAPVSIASRSAHESWLERLLSS
jgi:acetyl esterase/lipase